jgi:hypothetical protein
VSPTELAMKALGDCQYTPNKSTPIGTGTNLTQEKVDVCKQELIAVEINTRFKS